MNILIIYTTNSGSTEMAANEVMQQLSGKHQVSLKRASEATNDDIQAANLVILGSPSWDHDGKEGQPHDDMFAFKDRVDTTLFSGKPMAIFGCGDSSYQIFCGAVDEMTNWTQSWGAKVVVDPLRMDKYYFQLTQNQELIKAWAEKFPASV